MPETKSHRACGILLHISSLPSKYGIGDLGPDAHAFAETLAAAELRYWQFLPLTPTSPFIGNSPYSSPSAFAGNPLFISPEYLMEDGFIGEPELTASLEVALPDHHPGQQTHLHTERNSTFPPQQAHLAHQGPARHSAALSTVRAAVLENTGRVDFEAVSAQRNQLLALAFDLLLERGTALEDLPGYRDFESENAYWLDDYALFAALKEAHRGAGWVEWPDELKRRDPAALESWRGVHLNDIGRQKFIQYLFHRQWNSLHKRCRSLGVRLVSDMPIYVTHDSADVWARPDLYRLDRDGQPIVVAGVPPDYFSETGQRWGNPVYDWPGMQRENFHWWIKRMEHNLRQADLVRLDHFRGFCAYWEIPAEEETAVKGRWVEAPGRELLTALRSHFGSLPIIAEDLGIITPDVRQLMADFDLPGMTVLQFGFGGAPGSAPDAPFRHKARSVVYTGTHDNPPTRQWFAEAPDQERNNFTCYRGQDMDPDLANEVLMRMALESHAHIAVLPMQDVLRLGPEARMNTPSLAKGNWGWRLTGKTGWLPPEHWRGNCREQQPDQPPAQGQASNSALQYEGSRTETRQPEAAGQAHGTGQPTAQKADAREAINRCAPPVPDIFGHVHFLCRFYGRLDEPGD